MLAPDVDGVSIPIGFSGSLQHYVVITIWKGDVRFQSLSGFLVRCNTTVLDSNVRDHAQFQSLSGFLVRCNNVSDWHMI